MLIYESLGRKSSKIAKYCPINAIPRISKIDENSIVAINIKIVIDLLPERKKICFK